MNAPRVLYGDVVLDASDAYHAALLDIEYGHACPLVAFDPSDLERLMVQDQLVAEGVLTVDFGAGWTRTVTGADPFDKLMHITDPERVEWRYPGADDVFAAYLDALRNAAALPLDALQGDIARLLELAVQEAHRRVRVVARIERGGRFEDWQTFDLVGAVEAVAGSGRKSGRSIWFHCPWHSDSDASLHVDEGRKLWHCFSCDRGGGSVDWRKAREVAA